MLTLATVGFTLASVSQCVPIDGDAFQADQDNGAARRRRLPSFLTHLNHRPSFRCMYRIRTGKIKMKGGKVRSMKFASLIVVLLFSSTSQAIVVERLQNREFTNGTSTTANNWTIPAGMNIARLDYSAGTNFFVPGNSTRRDQSARVAVRYQPRQYPCNGYYADSLHSRRHLQYRRVGLVLALMTTPAASLAQEYSSRTMQQL